MNLKDCSDLSFRLIWMTIFVPSSYAMASVLHKWIGEFSMGLFWLCTAIGMILILFGSNWLVRTVIERLNMRENAAATISLFLYAPGVPDEVLTQANLIPRRIRISMDAADLISSIPRTRDPLVREVANRLKDCVNQDKTFNVGRIIENAPILIELRGKLRS